MPNSAAPLAVIFPGLSQGSESQTALNQKTLSPLGRCAAEAISSALHSNILTTSPTLLARGIQRDRRAMGQLFVRCLSDWEALQNTGANAGVFAAYSAGIYPALVASGVAVEASAELMAATLNAAEELCPRGDLLGVVGLSLAEVEGVLPESLHVSHHNGERHVLVGGDDGQLQALLPILKGMGVFSAKLMGLAFPYHTPQLSSVTVRGGELYRLGKGVFPTLKTSIVTGTGDLGMMVKGVDAFEATLSQMSEPISWPLAIHLLKKMGIKRLEVCGSGRSLLRWSTRMLRSGLEVD